MNMWRAMMNLTLKGDGTRMKKKTTFNTFQTCNVFSENRNKNYKIFFSVNLDV